MIKQEDGARMNFASCFVPGAPRGQSRPGRNGRRTFTNPKDAEYRARLVEAYKAAGGALIPGCVVVHIMVYYAIPKSYTKKQRALIESGELVPGKKPDIDNIAKLILDGLNGVAFEDDRFVVGLLMRKYYTGQRGIVTEPGVYVAVFGNSRGVSECQK